MQMQVSQFLDYLSDEKGCSQNTIAAYRNDITQYQQFLQTYSRPNLAPITEWRQVDAIAVQSFLLFLKEREYASSTVARKVAAVKSFSQYLLATGVSQSDPAAELDSPKVKKNLPRSIGPQEIEQLLAAPAKGTAPKDRRDSALMEILYATGMRVTELVNLNVEDVDLAKQTIVCGEGDKRRRTVPIFSAVALTLSTYLEEGRPQLLVDPAEPALFLNHRGQRLTRQGLWLIIKHYVQEVGIKGSVTPHTLRHSFATHLLNSGAGLREVQERLGHANLSTTQVYRQISSESAAELTVDGVPLPTRTTPQADETDN